MSFRSRRFVVAVLAAVVAGGCSSATPSSARGGAIAVVAAENFWGNIVSQLGGSHVHVTSIITDPSADPHLYESDARDGAAVSSARLVVENGLGYDDFVDQLLSASPTGDRLVLNVAGTLHVGGADANPHLWYDIPKVPAVASAIVADLSRVDPAHAADFTANLTRFNASLKPLTDLMAQIERQFANAPVAYTERVPGYLLADLGLDVKTPPGFAQAIEDGNEPSAGDTQSMDALMTNRAVRALLYNAQATSPVTQHVRDLAMQSRVAVVAVTETLPSNEPDYQTWQLHQLEALRAALDQ